LNRKILVDGEDFAVEEHGVGGLGLSNAHRQGEVQACENGAPCAAGGSHGGSFFSRSQAKAQHVAAPLVCFVARVRVLAAACQT
jgi:hypothetical protein